MGRPDAAPTLGGEGVVELSLASGWIAGKAPLEGFCEHGMFHLVYNLVQNTCVFRRSPRQRDCLVRFKVTLKGQLRFFYFFLRQVLPDPLASTADTFRFANFVFESRLI